MRSVFQVLEDLALCKRDVSTEALAAQRGVKMREENFVVPAGECAFVDAFSRVRDGCRRYRRNFGAADVSN